METRVYEGHELYKTTRAQMSANLANMKFVACIECRAWAPVRTDDRGRPMKEKGGRGNYLPKGTIADTPTRKLRQRAYALTNALVTKMARNQQWVTTRVGMVAEDYVFSDATKNLKNLYMRDQNEHMLNINELGKEQLEHRIEWLRKTRREMEEEVSV